MICFKCGAFVADHWEMCRVCNTPALSDYVALYRHYQAKLVNSYIPGAWGWILEDRPDLAERIKVSGNTWGIMALSAHRTKTPPPSKPFVEALEQWASAWREGMAAFTEEQNTVAPLNSAQVDIPLQP
ncbi:MAG: hypothetical protein OEZ04_10270 [Nitrospinota bacterium]|nr:hypothetical protein [Nitrospinota bacterium]